MAGTFKYSQIFEDLKKAIRDGQYARGVPLPSEEAIVRKYGVSRITAVKAMDELVKCGLVYRRRGKGTFASRTARLESGRLGLIMPSLSFGEVFPLMCQELMRCAQRDGYTMLLGDISAGDPRKRAKEACEVARMFVRERVAGVVLQPLAFLSKPDRLTSEMLALFETADIPVVLIDRDIDMGADPVRHDFVGIDNISAGRILCAHVVACGAKRVRFLMRPNCASVIRDRFDGVVSVLGAELAKDCAIVAEPGDAAALRAVFSRRTGRPDAVICESDYVAAVLRNTLAKIGLAVPGKVMLAGFDDVRCAVTMTPALTTIHQPCADIARVAYRTLRERIVDASLPPRRILIPAPLVVRESTALSHRIMA
ncbi:MAG: GntR family transcriptional regulator [Kiritimatiellae bacterium]|nr:GntR family transcriptional regulator [Kiritimatiellia bacterium]MBQ3341308.1 GntR family transcriptional regulator [Kiritimatiellia bacterium]